MKVFQLTMGIPVFLNGAGRDGMGHNLMYAKQLHMKKDNNVILEVSLYHSS